LTINGFGDVVRSRVSVTKCALPHRLNIALDLESRNLRYCREIEHACLKDLLTYKKLAEYTPAALP
jgi:hypothetical protein